ncbi:MAG: hypothetical protein VYB24_03710, partial [Pseudomonadota bacterium]|nr:hypothetical protein [Pseudomonadota bacterium]
SALGELQGMLQLDEPAAAADGAAADLSGAPLGVDARAMADALVERGYQIVSGGTDNHLFLLDLIDKNITGKDADAALGRANITVNKNAVPNDTRSPFVTSGLRLGSPASTTRGFKEAEMRMVANWIADVLDSLGDESVVDTVRGQVKTLCARHPVYRSS